MTFDFLSPGQGGVGHSLLFLPLREDFTLFHAELRRRDCEMFSGQLQELPAGRGGGRPQRRSKEAGAHGAEGAHVPRAEVGVAHHHVDVIERDVELIGQHLGQRSNDALPHFDLTGEAGNPAIFADLKEGIEIVG